MSTDQYAIQFNCSTSPTKDVVVHAQLNSWEELISQDSDPGPSNQSDFHFSVPRSVLTLESGDQAEALCIFLASAAISNATYDDDLDGGAGGWQIMQEMLWNDDPDTRVVLTVSVDQGPQTELPWPYQEKFVLATVASGVDVMSTKLKLMEKVHGSTRENYPSPRRPNPKI